MVTDSQRLGVLTGQFIRAQRLCSVMPMFKDAIKNVVLAAMRRGYKKGELDRVWGKFLIEWWLAREVRRGELRAWFRRLMRVVDAGMSSRRFVGENCKPLANDIVGLEQTVAIKRLHVHLSTQQKTPD